MSGRAIICSSGRPQAGAAPVEPTALSAEAIRLAAGAVTLQTSEAGAAVYRAMGFHEVGSYDLDEFPVPVR